MKTLVGSLIALVIMAAVVSGPSLKIDKRVYAKGEKIEVTFIAPEEYASNAWIGIIPSSIPHGDESRNDQHDIAYQHINNRASGVMAFSAPSQAGKYDLRMNDSDNSGREVAYVSFTVGDYAQTPKGHGPYMSITKTLYHPGEEIVVSFTASAAYADNAWIGIIPSSTPHGSEATNDQFDLSYQYLHKKTSGTLSFRAPAKPGRYDLRMHDTDNNGTEVFSVTFTVR